MAIIPICLPIFVLFVLFDLVPRIKEKQWKEFWIYTVLISAAYVIHILIALSIKLPSPSEPIKMLVQLIFGIQNE